MSALKYWCLECQSGKHSDCKNVKVCCSKHEESDMTDLRTEIDALLASAQKGWHDSSNELGRSRVGMAVDTGKALGLAQARDLVREFLKSHDL